MKALKLFVVFIILHCVLSHNRIKANSITLSAIEGILLKYFANNSWPINLVHYGKEDVKNEKLIKEILCKAAVSTAFRVTKGGTEFPWKSKLNTSSILLFDSVQTFKVVS